MKQISLHTAYSESRWAIALDYAPDDERAVCRCWFGQGTPADAMAEMERNLKEPVGIIISDEREYYQQIVQAILEEHVSQEGTT